MNEIDYRVEKRNLCEDVAAKMEQYILKNADKFGERLPSEQTLAINFGVSRPVIREALKLLKARQLIESNNGGGSFIHKPDTQHLSDVINRMIQMDRIDYVHIFNIRLLLEPYACRLAAINHLKNRDKLTMLEEMIDNMEKSEHNTDDRIFYDIQFHIHVARLSDNPILAAFIQSMTGLLTPLLRDALAPPDGHRCGVDYHRLLLKTIRKGDGDEGERVMREHINASTLYYLEGREKSQHGV